MRPLNFSLGASWGVLLPSLSTGTRDQLGILPPGGPEAQVRILSVKLAVIYFSKRVDGSAFDRHGTLDNFSDQNKIPATG